MERDNELYELSQECLTLFKALRTLPQATEDDWVEDRAAEFMWWAHGLKALKTGRSSLDYRVRNRLDIQKVLSGLLRSLSQSLKWILEEHTNPKKATQSEDENDADNEEVEDIDETPEDGRNSPWSEFSDEASNGSVTEDKADKPQRGDTEKLDENRFYILTYIALLGKASFAIRKAGTKLRYLKADTAHKELNENDGYDKLRAHLRFLILVGPYEQLLFSRLASLTRQKQLPKAVEIVTKVWITDKARLSPIQRRLVEANVTRRNRILHSRKVFGKQRVSLPQPQKESRPVIDEVLLAANVPLPPSPRNSNAGSEFLSTAGLSRDAVSSRGEQSLKTITATEIGSQFVLPSWNEPKAPKATSLVTKITHTGVNKDYPRVPAKRGTFKCPFCVQILSDTYTSDSKWRGHVAQDLLPYSCIYIDCPDWEEMYASKDEWTKHMKSTHSIELWICDECTLDEIGFENESEWRLHMETRHRGTYTSAQLSLSASLSKRKLLQPLLCPLCKRSPGSMRPDQDEHIADHLHSWALRALPWDGDSADEESTNSRASAGSKNHFLTNSDPADFTEYSKHGDFEFDRGPASEASFESDRTLGNNDDIGFVADTEQPTDWHEVSRRNEIPIEDDKFLQHLIKLGAFQTEADSIAEPEAVKLDDDESTLKTLGKHVESGYERTENLNLHSEFANIPGRGWSETVFNAEKHPTSSSRSQQQLIEELVNTEGVFLTQSREAQETWEALAKNSDSKVKKAIQRLIGNGASIIKLHEQLHTSFNHMWKGGYISSPLDIFDEDEWSFLNDQRNLTGRIAQVFVECRDEMTRIYDGYLQDTVRSDEALGYILQNHIGPSNIRNPAERANLRRHLMLPVQRINFYVTFISRLMDITSKSQADYKDVYAAHYYLQKIQNKESNKREKDSKIVQQIVEQLPNKSSEATEGHSTGPKSFRRRFSAFGQPAKTDSLPNSSEFWRLKKDFNDDYKKLHLICNNIIAYNRQTSTHLDEFMELLASMISFAVLDSPQEPDPINQRCIHLGQSFMQVRNGPMKSHLEEILEHVFRPLESLMKEYARPTLVINEIERRSGEYQQFIRLYVKGDHVPPRLLEAVEQYEALNRILQQELPQLRILSTKLISICLGYLVNSQKRWYYEWQRIVSTELAPDYDAWTEGLADIMGQFEQSTGHALEWAWETYQDTSTDQPLFSPERMRPQFWGNSWQT